MAQLFYDLVEQHELLSSVFGGRVGDEHRRHVTSWWCEVMGGPADYTEKLGGYERMLGRHLGLAITPEQRLRFVTLPRRVGIALRMVSFSPGACWVATSVRTIPDGSRFTDRLIATLSHANRLSGRPRRTLGANVRGANG